MFPSGRQEALFISVKCPQLDFYRPVSISMAYSINLGYKRSLFEYKVSYKINSYKALEVLNLIEV